MSQKTHAMRLSRIAHELRGPAGVALGAAQELARQAGGGEPFVGMLQRGLSRVLRIADRLARASALQNGIVEFNLQALDLGELVTREARSAIVLEHKSSAAVDIEVEEHGRIVLADEEWLSFCLRELVANAVQHAKHKVSVRVHLEDLRVIVEIEDDGPGFREIPAFNFDAPPNPRRGVGLSLPICHCVLTRHHAGTLVVDKSEMGGARVSFSLAINEPK